MSCIPTTFFCAAALALPLLCRGQVVLVEDQRHVEMSANGEAAKGDTCDDAQEVVPESAFGDGPLSAMVGCETAFTSASGAAQMTCLTSADRLEMRGTSTASASCSAEGAAASAFATSHYIMLFRVETATEFRFSARLVSAGGEATAELRREDFPGGEAIASFASSNEEPETVFRVAGLLEPGEYRLEIEGFSLVGSGGAQGPENGSASAAFDGLFLAGPGAACPADHDLNGVVDGDDLAGFIADFFASPRSHACDVDGSGIINPDDLSDFIFIFFLGC